MPLMIDAKIKPSGDFAIVDAKDVAFENGRLSDHMFVALTLEQYKKKEADGTLNENTPYLIIEG